MVATMAFAVCQTPLSLTAASEGGVPCHHLHFKDEKREVEDRGRDDRASCWLSEGLKHRKSRSGVYVERGTPEHVTQGTLASSAEHFDAYASHLPGPSEESEIAVLFTRARPSSHSSSLNGPSSGSAYLEK